MADEKCRLCQLEAKVCYGKCDRLYKGYKYGIHLTPGLAEVTCTLRS